jgi:hypothetical protein
MPTAPHFAAGTSLWITSGETGASVTGATVFVSGKGLSGPIERTYVSDAAGRVTLDTAVLHTPVPAIDITVTGFLKRETTLTPEVGQLFALWPTSSPTGLDEEFSAFIVYSGGSCPARRDPGFVVRHAPETQVATVVLASNQQTERDFEVHQAAIDLLNAATGNRPRYVLATVAPPSGVVFTTRMDPAYGVCPTGQVAAYFTRFQTANHELTGGEINYCSEAFARSPRIVAHELGHTYGLAHSNAPDLSDTMSCTTSFGDTAFSPREVLAMKLMMLRPGGNNWPDRDRPLFPSGTATQSTASGTTTVVCPLSGG